MRESFFARHSLKPDKISPESPEYKGLSEKGVELAREKAREVLEILEKSEPGTVMFIGGASEAIRTKSTARVFGEEVKELANKDGKEDILVLTEKDIADREKGYSQIVEGVTDLINANKDKKVIVDFPLMLKEFAMKPWMDDKGNLSEYTQKLMAKNNNNSNACVKEWITTGGKTNDLQGPDPEQIAKDHIKGVERLTDFARKYIENRPLVIGFVGHSWNLDALAVYLANNGKIDAEGFQKVGGEMIKDSEIGRIEIRDGEAVLNYKNKEYPVNLP